MKPFLSIAATITIASILTGILPGCSKTQQTVMTGMAETAEIDIAAKIAGRLNMLYVNEGDVVKEGDTVARFESLELDAKVGQARAALAAARAKLSMAQNGLRPQEKDAAERMFLQAKAQADLMEKTWTRMQKLSRDSVVSAQEFDQIEAQYLAAKEAMEGAKLKVSMAKEGTRIEDRSAAVALVAQAEQAYQEALAWRNEQILTSPISGEVAKKIAHKGEIVSAGAPILTLVDPSDIWVIVSVKETDMNQFRMGAEFKGKIPALGDTVAPFVVTFIAPMGEFASWRPTNQKGGFDIKTFEIHARPQSRILGLRAGMTVNFEMNN